MFRPLVFHLAFVVGLLVARPVAADEARRIALVIGEASYKTGVMPTAKADAGVVARALAQAGFDVTGYADLDRDGLRHAFEDFGARALRAGPDAIAFVYLAGHGVQFNGDNYIVPVEATIALDVDVSSEAIRLSDLSRDLAATPLKARIHVYDLASANGFAPLASGLALLEAPAGSLVAFNAAPGTVSPSNKPPYGLYAQALSEMMAMKDLPIEAVFTRVRLRVAASSNGAIVPWNTGALDDGLALFPFAKTDEPAASVEMRGSMDAMGASNAFWTAIARDTVPAYAEMKKAFPNDGLTSRIEVMLAARREASTWTQALRAKTANALWTYMRRYPRGPHFADARRGLAALSAALEPPPRFDIVTFQDLPPPMPEEVALINRPFLSFDDSRLAPVPPPPAALVPPVREAFHQRAAPSIVAGTLPIPEPVPLGFAWKSGRIELPVTVPSIPPAPLITRPTALPAPDIMPAPDMARRAAPIAPVSTAAPTDVMPPRQPMPPAVAPVQVPNPIAPTIQQIVPAMPASPRPASDLTAPLPAPIVPSASPPPPAPASPAPLSQPPLAPRRTAPSPRVDPVPVPNPNLNTVAPSQEALVGTRSDVPLPPRRPTPASTQAKRPVARPIQPTPPRRKRS